MSIRKPCNKQCKKCSSNTFFTSPPSLQSLSCGNGCDSAITVETWNGVPGVSGVQTSSVGLDLCDKLI